MSRIGCSCRCCSAAKKVLLFSAPVRNLCAETTVINLKKNAWHAAPHTLRQRVLNELLRVRLSCGRMVWLLALPLTPPPYQQVVSACVSLVELSATKRVGEEPNQESLVYALCFWGYLIISLCNDFCACNNERYRA